MAISKSLNDLLITEKPAKAGFFVPRNDYGIGFFFAPVHCAHWLNFKAVS